jgi:hypothetical protein
VTANKEALEYFNVVFIRPKMEQVTAGFLKNAFA